jgi:MSHA pilin protein MshC
MQNQTGFTLVELVVVILIGGILAVTVLPKFFSVDGENLQGQRDQLLALTHQLQLQSMQDTANLTATCPTLAITATAAGFTCAADGSFTLDANNSQQISWQANAVVMNRAAVPAQLPLPLQLRFNSWGVPQGACAGGCAITLSQPPIEHKFCVERSGYIHLC